MTRARRTAALAAAAIAGLAAGLSGQQGTATVPGNIWPPAKKQMARSIALSPGEEMKTFSMPPGFRVELAAAEPLIESPILMEFDPDGRMWVVEMLTFLPDTSGRDSREPINRVSVLEDTDGDGVMDKKTVFAGRLQAPRALKVLDRGVLIGDPPNVWLMRDTDGDLVADTKEIVVSTYGNPNGGIEHNANSLFWALDNVMYSSEHVWDLRWKQGRFEPLPALSRGQWLISQDDAGRIYRNVNDSPLFVDYTPSRYFLRNPNGVRTRGLYELLIEQRDATIYPVRDTRGVNRGYRDPFFRPDGSSIVIQGTSGPAIYRGDAYPAELRGNAFIADSPTNLVHRLVIEDDGGGRLTARNGYARGEFLASSDERFRPVAVVDGPDGNLYVVDMYRGVVQAGGLWSEYLSDYIRTNDLLLPVARGRIWRVVYGRRAARPATPALSSATSAELVDALSNPKGWWRDTAQRLLVERGDTTVAPALASLAARAPDWRTRLHALWTLDGLDRIDAASVRRALGDPNGAVRAAAVRLSERWLAADAALRGAVLALMSDRNWNVRRQVAASIGEMPERDRVDPAAAILIRDGADAIVVDAAVSSLKGIEADVLAKVIQSTPAAASPGEAVSMLAGAVAKSGDAAAVGRVIDVAADASRPQWTRAALLRGLDAGLPARGAGTGRGRAASGGLPGLSVPGGRIQVTPGRGVSLSAEPAALSALAQKGGLLATLAKTVSAKLDWPGRPAPAETVPPLTAIQQKRYDAGVQIYKNVCAGCHQEDGRGKDKLGASLIDSPLVTAADASGSIRVLLSGKDGAIGLMPPLGPAMSDEEIAAALTYIRRAWGHTASAVDPLNVMEIRALSAQSRYRAAQTGDIVELHDTRADVAVKVLAPASNAYQMTVKGQDVLRRTWASIDDIRQRMGLNGIPLLWPYANRLDEQAFYANGQKYSFDPGLGNTGRGAIPIHGFLQNTTAWKVVEVRADARSAWITSKLEFFRVPQYMKQFPFAHTLTMTYRLQDGALEVRTRIDNLSADPLPVTIGFHPYFQLTDAPRAAWRLSLAAKTHWLLDERTIPTGETQPIAKRLPDPASVAVDTEKLDDVFTDLERDAQGWSTMSLKGRNQQIDVVLGPRFKTILVYSGAAGSVALEPMAGISNAMNLAHRGVYKELQSIEPGGFWEESFWIRPRGY